MDDLQWWMKNFIWIGQIESSIEAIDDGQKSAAGSFESADENDDHVAVGIQVHGVIYTVHYFSRSLKLLANAQYDFNGQEFD